MLLLSVGGPRPVIKVLLKRQLGLCQPTEERGGLPLSPAGSQVPRLEPLASLIFYTLVKIWGELEDLVLGGGSWGFAGQKSVGGQQHARSWAEPGMQ